MIKIGRNEPCPCGSGKKFKKCHIGREDELTLDGISEFTREMSDRITNLSEVKHGRTVEMMDSLDIYELTGSTMGIRFIDLKLYSDMNFLGGTHSRGAEGQNGGVFINIYKTMKSDPDNIYLAISENIDDSILVHEIAHALDYLGGSGIMPGTQKRLSIEMSVPVEHLEHSEEYGYWLDFLTKKFSVRLDADDRIISYLYQKGMLLKGEEIRSGNNIVIKTGSEKIFRFMSENSREIDGLIRDLDGYIGSRTDEA